MIASVRAAARSDVDPEFPNHAGRPTRACGSVPHDAAGAKPPRVEFVRDTSNLYPVCVAGIVLGKWTGAENARLGQIGRVSSSGTNAVLGQKSLPRRSLTWLPPLGRVSFETFVEPYVSQFAVSWVVLNAHYRCHVPNMRANIPRPHRVFS